MDSLVYYTFYGQVTNQSQHSILCDLWAFLHYVVSVLWAILSGFWVCLEWNFEWFCGVLSGLGAVLHCECFCVLWLVNVSHVTQLKQVIVCYDFWGKCAIVWWVCVLLILIII